MLSYQFLERDATVKLLLGQHVIGYGTLRQHVKERLEFWYVVQYVDSQTLKEEKQALTFIYEFSVLRCIC